MSGSPTAVQARTPSSAAPPGRAGARLLAVVLLLLAGWSVHGSALDHGFVSWDDDINLFENPRLVAGPLEVGPYWTAPYQGLYIPVTYTVWTGLAAIAREELAPGRFTLDPAPFHAANLVLHLSAMLLVATLLWSWLPSAPPRRRLLAASAGALLFGLHPIQVEAVHWATALKDVLSTSLALLALVLVPRAPQRVDWRLPVSWLAFALALLAKPGVIVLPLLWLLCLWARGERVGRLATVHLAALAGLAGAGAWLLLRVQPGGAAVQEPGLVERASVVLDSLGHHLGQLLPIHPSAPDLGRSVTRVLSLDQPTGQLLLASAFLGLTAWLAWRGRGRLAAGLLAFPAALLPTLGLLSFSHQRFSTVADRYAYLALLVPAWWLAHGLLRSRGWLVWPLVGAGLCVLGLLSRERSQAWQDSRVLWEHTLTVQPASATAWTNLGFLEEQAGRVGQARQHYLRALDEDPGCALALVNLGNQHLREGAWEAASERYEQALSSRPDDLHARNNLGAVRRHLGDPAGARQLFQDVVTDNPQYAPAWGNLALVHLETGAWSEAEDSARRALAIDPGFRAAGRSLARSLVEQGGRDAEARAVLERALPVDDGDPQGRAAWAELLDRAGRSPEAVLAARWRAFEGGSRHPAFLDELARELSARDRAAQSEAVLRARLEQLPVTLPAFLALADRLEARQAGDELGELLRQAARRFPGAAEPLVRLAALSRRRGARDEAERLLALALVLDPELTRQEASSDG